MIAVFGSFVVVLGAASPVAAGDDGGKVAIAEAAIGELTASLPGLFPVQGGGQYAPVPECDVILQAEDLAAAGDEVLQAYGGESGGGSGWIVVLDSKKDAKRFFKLVNSDDAVACVIATNEVGLAPLTGGAAASGDLERGKLSGVKKSATREGTITVGELVFSEARATVQRGNVVIFGGISVPAGSDVGLSGIVTEWVKATAKKY